MTAPSGAKQVTGSSTGPLANEESNRNSIRMFNYFLTGTPKGGSSDSLAYRGGLNPPHNRHLADDGRSCSVERSDGAGRHGLLVLRVVHLKVDAVRIRDRAERRVPACQVAGDGVNQPSELGLVARVGPGPYGRVVGLDRLSDEVEPALAKVPVTVRVCGSPALEMPPVGLGVRPGPVAELSHAGVILALADIREVIVLPGEVDAKHVARNSGFRRAIALLVWLGTVPDADIPGFSTQHPR